MPRPAAKGTPIATACNALNLRAKKSARQAALYLSRREYIESFSEIKEDSRWLEVDLPR